MTLWLGRYGIFLILGLALAARVYHITFPIAGFQAWRQADTAMIAKNFYENGFNILYPQIDWGGNVPGYVETEFPVYSFLVSLLYALFTPSDAWGRLLSVVFALVAIYGLYVLVKKFLSEQVALIAALVYAIVPLNIYYSRAFMPESMMLACSILAVYFFSEWIDKEKTSFFVCSALFATLAPLIKLPALYIGLPLLFFAVKKFGGKTLLHWELWLYAALVLVPVILWYYHARQVYLSHGLTFGIWDYGSGKWGNYEPLLTPKFYNDIFFKSIAERHLTWGGFVLFVVGLFLPRRTEGEKVFDWWLVAIIVYFFIVAVGNQIHEYYQLPFTVPASVYIAKSIHAFLSPPAIREKWVKRKTVVAVLGLCAVAIPILSFLRIHNLFSQENRDTRIFKLADAVQIHTSPQDLVVAVDENDPVLLYRCKRRGWHSSPDGLAPDFLTGKTVLGAKYLVGMNFFFDSEERQAVLRGVLRSHAIVVQTEDYFIVRLVE